MSASFPQSEKAALYIVNVITNMQDYPMLVKNWDKVLYYGELQQAERHRSRKTTYACEQTVPPVYDFLWVCCCPVLKLICISEIVCHAPD